MPTVSKKKIRRVGKPDIEDEDKSGILTLPIDYVRYLEKLTGQHNPSVEVWGNSVLIIKPEGIKMDYATRKGVEKLLDDIQNAEKL